ncbi:MAG TPA: alpha/beta hydrolase [Actinophytocola sp.]|jgi:alpha-beta hydrolase superfamily lysophospholipase|nr:alpha/beta hydrolase [Actinophytocola sp.]
MREFTFPGRDGQTITAYRWEPAAAARGIVQLTHGMGEHVRRYDALAGALTGEGFLVVGQDHRGHGSTATTLGELGPGGWDALVDDIGVLAGLTKAEHPGLPHVLVAHSMGSFAAQQYLLDHSRDVTAVALTGTSLLDLLEPALEQVDAPLELSAFNAPFLPARTDYDWLSRDEEQVDRYVADPHCGFGIDPASTRAMFAGARAVADPARLAAMRADLPVYVAVGELDPVGGQTALARLLVDRYRAAGLTDVTLTVYPGARHEVFNETNRDEVVAALLAWLARVSA